MLAVMGNINIKYSDNFTDDSLIYDLIEIEKDVYKKEYCGKYEMIHDRFHRYKDMFILAYDNDKVIGYLCFFPISNSLEYEIIYTENFHDDDIEPKDIVEIEKNNNIYLISIALYKRYHRKGIGKLMMSSFFDKMRTEKKVGHNINKIIASVVTVEGETLLNKYGFKLVNDLMEKKNYKLYIKEGKEI